MGQVTRHVWENCVSFLECRNFSYLIIAIFSDFQKFAENGSDAGPRDEDEISNLLIPRILSVSAQVPVD